jgi:Family of unknown function (DUF5677)
MLNQPMFDRSKQLLHSNNLSEIRGYVTELTHAMQRTTLDSLVYIHECPQIVSMVTQLMNSPMNYGYRIAERLGDEHAYDIDLLAAAVRNLFECWVTFQYLKEDQYSHFENRVLEMLQRDELDLIEASRMGADPSIKVPDFAQSHLLQLKEAKPPKHLHISKLAERAKVESEYQQYYKLYCKYVHPSLFLMIGEQGVVYSQTIVRIIAKRAVIYLESFANSYEEFHLFVRRKLESERGEKQSGI